MTMMETCYPNYDLLISQGFSTDVSVISKEQQESQLELQMSQILKKPKVKLHEQQQSLHITSTVNSVESVVACAATLTNLNDAGKKYLHTPKDYFVPLHVDCSVEYELPKQPKPPAGQRVEPLLMIHPCYFRKMESQRRSPFINNMPNSSRNGAAMFVGVALVSQCSNNITPASSSISFSKRTSVRNNQHQYHTRQNSSLQYGSISRTDHQHPMQATQQQKTLNSLPLMSQPTHYPEISMSTTANAKFLEQSATPIRRTATATIDGRLHHHLLRSTQTKSQTNQQQQEHLVQNSSSSKKSAPTQWDQLAAVATIVTSSMTEPNPNKLFSASINNTCDAAGCSIASSSSLGKRDAMISGSSRCSTNSSSSNNNTLLRIQMNKINNDTSSTLGKRKNTTIIPNRSCFGSTCLVDSAKLPWNPSANNTSLTIDRSPIATVPSNFQAGPDSTPTTSLQNKYRTLNDNNTEGVNKNNILSCSGKYKQYLRPNRVHPYFSRSSHSDPATLALSSVATNCGDVQVFPQFSAAKAAVAAAVTATSFQQHMQQISCYNV